MCVLCVYVATCMATGSVQGQFSTPVSGEGGDSGCAVRQEGSGRCVGDTWLCTVQGELTPSQFLCGDHIDTRVNGDI